MSSKTRRETRSRESDKYEENSTRGSSSPLSGRDQGLREVRIRQHYHDQLQLDARTETTRAEASLSHRTSSTQGTNDRIKAITEEIHKNEMEKPALQEKISDLEHREILIKTQKRLDKEITHVSKIIKNMAPENRHGHREHSQNLKNLEQKHRDTESELSDIANKTKGYSIKHIGLLKENKEIIEESIKDLHTELDSILKTLKTKIIQKDEEILKIVNSTVADDIEVLMTDTRLDTNKLIQIIYNIKIKNTSDDPNSQNLNSDQILQLKQSALTAKEFYLNTRNNPNTSLWKAISVKLLGNPRPIQEAGTNYSDRLLQYADAKITYTIDNCQEYQERLNLQRLLEEAESKIR